MKLQIDTVAKTIKLEQSAKIVEFISLVKKLLPNDWKEYSVMPVENIYNWVNPIYVPYTPMFTYTDSTEFKINSNTEVYCIESN